MNSTIYTNTQFDQFREQVLKGTIARHKVSLAGIEIISETAVKYGGIHFSLDPAAFNTLLKVLNISKGLRTTMLKQFGVNFVDKFISSISNKLEGAKAEVVMLVNTKQKKIINFLKSDEHMISNTSYFKEVEKVIDQYGLDVYRMNQNPDNGSFSIATTSPNSQWGIEGLKDEVFKFGLNFSNHPVKGTQMGTYNERLICTNGMSTMQMTGSCKLSNHAESWKEYEHSLMLLSKQGFRPDHFGAKVKGSMNTQASIAELQQARNMVLASTTLDEQTLETYLPYYETVEAYNRQNQDINMFNKEKKKNAESSITYWELINDITYIASNMSGIGLKNPDNLQLHAGKLLSKTPDTSNLVLSPF